MCYPCNWCGACGKTIPEITPRCVKCGAELVNGSGICPQCGARRPLSPGEVGKVDGVEESEWQTKRNDA